MFRRPLIGLITCLTACANAQYRTLTVDEELAVIFLDIEASCRDLHAGRGIAASPEVKVLCACITSAIDRSLTDSERLELTKADRRQYEEIVKSAIAGAGKNCRKLPAK